ncbi:MAG: EF-hand domain-containing protein [Promethearchaeia archaeon]
MRVCSVRVCPAHHEPDKKSCFGLVLVTRRHSPALARAADLCADGSGEIDAHELRQAMHDLGTELSILDTKRLLTWIDSDGNGSISFWEFVEFFTPRIGSKQVLVAERPLRASERACSPRVNPQRHSQNA